MLSVWYPTRNAQKLSSDGGKFAKLHLAEWPHPFDIRHNSDAHFWPYAIYVDGEPSELQIGVPTVGGEPKSIADNQAILLHYIVLEWDKDGHGKINLTDQEDFMTALARLPEDSPAAKFACFYWTRGGARLIYRLSTPVDWSEYRDLNRGLAREIEKHTDIRTDPVCDQWSRAFRLPYVVRADGKDEGATWRKEWFDFHIFDTTLDPSAIPPYRETLFWDTRGVSATFASKDLPDNDDALTRANEAFKVQAKRLLKNQDCYSYLFEGLQPAPGMRDAAVVKFAGQVTYYLHGKIPFLTPEHIYGLMLPMVDGVETEGEPLNEKLWRMIQVSWNGESKKEAERHEKRVQVTNHQDAFVDKLLRNFKERDLPKDPADRKSFAMRHVALAHGSSLYVANSEGQYSANSISPRQLPAALRDAIPWSPRIISEKTGALKSPQALMSSLSSNIQNVILVPGMERGMFPERVGDDWILNIVPYAPRRDIFNARQWDEDIDALFRSWGEEAHLAAYEWLPNAIALWDGPICALSICGPRACGKSLVARGFADCFGVGLAPAETALSRFNSVLMTTPFVIADEGLPQRVDGMSTPDKFRVMVSGSAYTIEGKNQNAIQSTIGLRFFLAANNNEMLRTIAGDKIMSRTDTEAISERVRHLVLPPNAGRLLNERGHHAWTTHDKKGKWIGGHPDDGGCRFARHIAELHYRLLNDKTRNRLRFNTRLLVTGKLDAKTQALLENGGVAPEVADCIAKDLGELIHGTAPRPVEESMRILNGGLFIRKRDYIHLLVQKIPGARNALVRRVLDRWSTGEERQIPVTPSSTTRLTWHGLKAHEIEQMAVVEGIDASPFVELETGILRP